MSLVTPRVLKRGDTIGIFTPSWPAHTVFRDKYIHGISTLKKLGFGVIEGSLTKLAKDQSYRSGTAKERANELMELFIDPKVDGIIATIGGSNSASLIPHLDFKVISENPKTFCGYSDVTSLHLALLKHANLRTYYGPALVPTFGEWPNPDQYSLESFFAATSGDPNKRVLTPPEQWSNEIKDANGDSWKQGSRRYRNNAGWKVVVEGSVSAPILSVNLNTFLKSFGTSYFPDLDGRILLVEQMSADYPGYESAFVQMKLAGVFDRVVGLIISKPEDFKDCDIGMTCTDLLIEIIGKTPSFPVIDQFDCGHTTPMITLLQESVMSIVANKNGDVEVFVSS